MKNKLVYNLFFLISGLLLLLNVSHAVPGGSGTIGAAPYSGTKLVNEEFNIVVGVTGSPNFTILRSTVILNNLTVVSFTDTAGDVIPYTEPSSGSLGFNLGVKGATGASSLNVYTIRVKATSAGSAGISFSDGRIVGTSCDCDFSVGYTNGSYTISAPTSTPLPTSTPIPTVAPTHTNVPGTTHTPTRTPTPTPIPNCTPACTGKTCGSDGCNGVCGICLSGYICSTTTFACELDPNLTEDQFVSYWDGIGDTGEVGLQLDLGGSSPGGFRFFGRTAPNVLLNLYIFSTPLIKTTTSDANGDWSITITEPLAAGNHTVYAVIVTNGLETKNSEVVAFNVDPISKVVALASYISPTPIPTVTPTPKVTSSNTTLTVVFVILIILLVITAIGFFIVSRKKKKQTNKSVEHMKKAMDGMPVEETEEEKATRKISSLGDN